MKALRVGVASIVQETNTFSPALSTMADFTSQGFARGRRARELFHGTNTELGGALRETEARGHEAIALVRAWAMSSGPITSVALAELGASMCEELGAAGRLDGLVLSLHGALVGEDGESGDLRLLEAAKAALGGNAVVGVCFDLHANLTTALEAAADCVVGYLTYPHVDQGSTGARTAGLVIDRLLHKSHPVTRFAKRPLLIAPEAQGADGPLGEVRRVADQRVREGCLDVSLFPVQPWLDVAELGFGVSVTTDADAGRAMRVAEEIAELTWQMRTEFRVSLETPAAAIARARRAQHRPVILSESADSPTSGTPGDSPAMVRELLAHGSDLRSCVSLVDPPAVAACRAAGEGARFSGTVGCTVEHRFHTPVHIDGVIKQLGEGSFKLTGPAFTGMPVGMGAYAVVSIGGTQVMITERPAPTFDPQAYRCAGIDLEQLDIVVVRSARLFRDGYAHISDNCIILDLPGASTPRLESLPYRRAPRPLFPLER